MSAAIKLIKRGFHEVPHLMLGSGIFLTSVVIYIFAANRHIKYDRDRRRWKRRYTVVREEEFDPKKQVHPIDRKYPMF